jgi:predicted GNAT family acetyltransferase
VNRSGSRSRARTEPQPLQIRELTPELWPAFEKLFGPNGACAGCWCMWWRIRQGERFMHIHGASAKRRQKALVLAGSSRGLLAFSGDEPVGWCAYGRRTDFPALARSRALACDDAEQVWSLPCFFIKSGWRGRGVARALLRAALESLRRNGARIAEAYPVRPPASNSTAFTGTVPWLEAEGFRVLTNRRRGRQRARLTL